jgi:mRNA interferase RelE/StbE
MKVEFRGSFLKDLRGIKEKKVLGRIQQTIEAVEAASRLEELPHLKKLQGTGQYYRIRTGDHRLGLIVEGDLVVFVRALDRKEIYRYFP